MATAYMFPRITGAAYQALVDAQSDAGLSPRDHGSSTISFLKKSGYVEPFKTADGRATRYRITATGRAVKSEAIRRVT